MTTTSAEQLRRVLHLIPHLADGEPHSLDSVARRAGVDRVVVLRDIQSISERFEVPGGFVEGLQIFIDSDDISVVPNHFLRPMRLTRSELLALELGLTMLRSEREADVVGEAGIEHRTTVMPVVANLDGEDHVEPAVEQTFLRFQVARAREEAVRRADGGDFDAAAASLRDAAGGLAACPAASGVAEEIEDLEAEASGMDQRRYDASDRKYHGARAMAARDLKAEYAQRVSRRRPRGT